MFNKDSLWDRNERLPVPHDDVMREWHEDNDEREGLAAGELAPGWKDCPVCHGAGELWWSPRGKHDPQEDRSDECPRCDGEGAVRLRPTVAPVPDQDHEAGNA